VAYALHAAARYFNEGWVPAGPSLAVHVLGRVSQGKSRLATATISSIAGVIFGIDYAADRLDQRVHPRVLLQATTVHAGRWFSMRARCWG